MMPILCFGAEVCPPYGGKPCGGQSHLVHLRCHALLALGVFGKVDVDDR